MPDNDLSSLYRCCRDHNRPGPGTENRCRCRHQMRSLCSDTEPFFQRGNPETWVWQAVVDGSQENLWEAVLWSTQAGRWPAGLGSSKQTRATGAESVSGDDAEAQRGRNTETILACLCSFPERNLKTEPKEIEPSKLHGEVGGQLFNGNRRPRAGQGPRRHVESVSNLVLALRAQLCCFSLSWPNWG